MEPGVGGGGTAAAGSGLSAGPRPRAHAGLLHHRQAYPTNSPILVAGPQSALHSLVVYLVGFAPGMGPMPWTINSEIYDTACRSHGTAISTSVNWVCNLLVAITFLDLCQAATPSGAFLIYAVVAMLGVAFFYRCLPETRGRALEEVAKLFERGAALLSPACGTCSLDPDLLTRDGAQWVRAALCNCRV